MCFNPKIMYRFTSDGKFKIRPFSCELLDELRNKNIFYDSKNFEMYLIGCGRCVECRLDYANKWAVRLSNENETANNSYFITFTYNNSHLPKGLNKDHLKQFFHSLKEHYYRNNHKECKIKYFACGEYGEHTFRPHYHAIIYNMPLSFEEELTKFFEDNKIHKSKTGEMLYYSPTIKKLWGKGFIQVEKDLNYNAFRYVAGYIQKKQYGKNTFYIKNNVDAPFIINSRGLGLDYFNLHKKTILETDEIFLVKNKKVRSVSTPRYYLKKLKEVSPLEFEKIFKQRAKITKIDLNNLSTFPYVEQLIYFRGKKEKGDRKDNLLIRNDLSENDLF